MDNDYSFTITYTGGQFSVSPSSQPSPHVTIDLDDSITFEVTGGDCRVCFSPKDVFGSHLRLRQGTLNSVTPCRTCHKVEFWIQDYGESCKKDEVRMRPTYSIKVGS
jgi:hypothetical protein